MSADRTHETGALGASAGPGRGTAPGAPWFRQFWPVFIAVLMAISIAASLFTVVLAYRHADEDVRRAAPVATGSDATGPPSPGGAIAGNPR